MHACDGVMCLGMFDERSAMFSICVLQKVGNIVKSVESFSQGSVAKALNARKRLVPQKSASHRPSTLVGVGNGAIVSFTSRHFLKGCEACCVEL